MSKLLALFKKNGSGVKDEDALRGATNTAMAHLLERNRKFELFLMEKLADLEKRSTPSPASAPGGAAGEGGDAFFDLYDSVLPGEEEDPDAWLNQVAEDEPLLTSKRLGGGGSSASPPKDSDPPASVVAPSEAREDTTAPTSGDPEVKGGIARPTFSSGAGPIDSEGDVEEAPPAAETKEDEDTAGVAPEPEAAQAAGEGDWGTILGLDDACPERSRRDDGVLATEASEQSLPAGDGAKGEFA